MYMRVMPSDSKPLQGPIFLFAIKRDAEISGTLFALSQNDLGGNSGSFPAHPGTPGSLMSPIVVESLPIVIIVQAVGSAEQDFVDLSAQGVSHKFKKFLSYLVGDLHACLICIHVLYPLSSRHHAQGHEGPSQRATGLAVPGNPARQGVPCHKGGLISDI